MLFLNWKKRVNVCFYDFLHLLTLLPVRKISCMKALWNENEIFMHENEISMHENEISMHENEISMHVNEISMHENQISMLENESVAHW